MTTNPQSTGQPLFIVDRDWLRQGPKARKSWTGNVRNRSLYGLAIQVTQYNTPEKGTRGRRKSRSTTKRRDKHDDNSGSDYQSEKEQNATSTLPVVNSQTRPQQLNTNNAGSADTRDHIPAISQTYAQLESWPENLPLQECSSPVPPGFERIKGLECYLDYYLDVIGTSQHPVETRFCLQSNPIRSSWFPLAFEDDLWLQNITMFSALHHASTRNEPPPSNASALMSSFLSQLNDRISRSDLSDGTIASVSCLALGEHIKGNDQLAKVHATGLAEMVRLRGGLETIQRARRAKIARADIVRSVDNLEPALLPRLMKELPSTALGDAAASKQLTETIVNMARSGLNPSLISALWTLGGICQHLESSWAGDVTLDATSYYENLLCLNHDLLSFEAHVSFDEVLRICLLNYTQPMFRYCAYEWRSCKVRARKLKVSFEKVDLRQCKEEVALWLVFNAYLFSRGMEEGPWFKLRLQATLDERHIPRTGAWSDIKANLQKFLWTDSIHDQSGKQFYDMLEQDDCVFNCHSNNLSNSFPGRRGSA